MQNFYKFLQSHDNTLICTVKHTKGRNNYVLLGFSFVDNILSYTHDALRPLTFVKYLVNCPNSY